MCVNDILYMTANLGLALTVLNFIHNMSHGNDKFGTVIMSAKMQLKKRGEKLLVTWERMYLKASGFVQWELGRKWKSPNYTSFSWCTNLWSRFAPITRDVVIHGELKYTCTDKVRWNMVEVEPTVGYCPCCRDIFSALNIACSYAVFMGERWYISITVS